MWYKTPTICCKSIKERCTIYTWKYGTLDFFVVVKTKKFLTLTKYLEWRRCLTRERARRRHVHSHLRFPYFPVKNVSGKRDGKRGAGFPEFHI